MIADPEVLRLAEAVASTDDRRQAYALSQAPGCPFLQFRVQSRSRFYDVCENRPLRFREALALVVLTRLAVDGHTA